LRATPFEFFRECWDKTLICAKQFTLEIEDAITFFLADLDSLFTIYTDNGYARFAYFKPELRIPILKAGRTQTLLKIRYKGSDRMVEPYSLKYLMRRDGVEREYLYVYNRMGGVHGPGIRCFVAEGIEAIENTEEKFEPRYPIELSKSGERPVNPYLFDPNRPVRDPGHGIRSSYGPRYIYKCSFCGKQFTKSTPRGNLQPHKNKDGYPCSGRYGYYVDTRY
jgi:DNA-directed RNA polymerase subunit RPC12/RpoP